MPDPNPAIIPGMLPSDVVPERNDLLPEEDSHFGNDDAHSKDGMSEEGDTSEPVPSDFR